MMTGATMRTPNAMTGGAPAAVHSSSKMCCSTAVQPGPPNSFGHVGPDQPRVCRMRCQPMMSSRESRLCSSTLAATDSGRFCRMKVRISSRKVFSAAEYSRFIAVSVFRCAECSFAKLESSLSLK